MSRKQAIKNLRDQVVTARDGFGVSMQDILEDPTEFEPEDSIKALFWCVSEILRILGEEG